MADSFLTGAFAEPEAACDAEDMRRCCADCFGLLVVPLLVGTDFVLRPFMFESTLGLEAASNETGRLLSFSFSFLPNQSPNA